MRISPIVIAALVAGLIPNAPGAVAAAARHPQTQAALGSRSAPAVALFAADSDALTEAARQSLDAFLVAYRADAGKHVVLIQGHSDTQEAGGQSRGQWELSQRRAYRVRDYLAAGGLPMSEMVAEVSFVGRGDDSRRAQVFLADRSPY